MGKYEQKAMTPTKKVVPIVKSSEDHSIQEQIAKIMVMVKASAQQAAVASRAVQETRAKLTAKITELQ